MKIFRKVPSLKFLYEINEDGVLRNCNSKKTINPITQDGYKKVVLKQKSLARMNVYIHRLVMECWGMKNPDPEVYTTVDHLDRNRSNNNVHNLRWATPKMQSENKKGIEFTEKGMVSLKNHGHKMYKCLQEWKAKFTPEEYKEYYISTHAKLLRPCMVDDGRDVHIFNSVQDCKRFLNKTKLSTEQRHGKQKIDNRWTFKYLEKVERLARTGVDNRKEEKVIEKAEPTEVGKI